MRAHRITDDSWTEDDALHLVRALANGPRKARSESGDEAARHAVLTKTVEDEVIPRLVMGLRPQQASAGTLPGSAPLQPDAEDKHVVDLTELVLNGPQRAATAYVEALHREGTPAEALFLDLLSPTARNLGDMWADDLCSCGDVTLGMIRLGNVLRLLGRAFSGDSAPVSAAPSALLVNMPGEQHGLGLSMVVHFFRNAGWNVHQAPGITRQGLIELTSRSWFGILGISVGCSDRLDCLAEDITTIRRLSKNHDIGIMVGGPPFLEHPQLATLVGADATAIDGRQAVCAAQTLLGQRACCS